MPDNLVPIDLTVELREQAALTEYYRNRTLIMAQALTEARAAIEQLETQVGELKSQIAAHAFQGSTVQ